jgi:hypothetical protein
MDPSIYQQQPQQQNRAPYPFTENPQGSSTVMGAGAYPEQYNMAANVANNTAYGTGINPMMPISGRPVYQVPVASIASITGNVRATAKRALGSGAQMQTIFSNMGQTSGQNQLYTTGFPNQQIIGRSTVPTQSFVNTDNQNMDGKSPAPIDNAYASSIQGINKYYGQIKPNSMGNNFNSLLNQNQSPHTQQSNQAIHNPIQQEESHVDWLEFQDDENIVYDFNCSTEFTNNASGMGGNIQGWNSSSIQSNLNYGSQNASKSYPSINQNNLQQSSQQQQDDQQLQQQTISEQQQQQERQSTPQPPSQQQLSQPPSIHITQPSQQQQQQREDTSYAYPLPSNSVSQNLSPKSIQNSSLGMLPRSPNLSSDSSRQSIYGNQSQGQAGSQIGQFTKMAPKDHLSTSNSLIANYSQSSTQSSISTEISSNPGIQNAVVDHYKQSPQSTVEPTSLKSNSLMNHLRITTQEHQGESTSILPSNDNPNSFNANVQVTSATSRMTSSTDIPKDISNIPVQTFNTEMLSSVLHPINNNNNNNNNNNQQQQQPPNQIGNIAQSSVVENATPNLRLPVSSGIAGRRNNTSRQVSRQSDKTNNSPLISSDQPPSIKPTHPKPPKVNYAPKTRRVDSYGGLDLRVFEKFSLPLTIPGIQDLGINLVILNCKFICLI